MDLQEVGFCCPLCGGTLSRVERRAVCPKGHSFDMARQGYLHLLPPNKMHAKVPGDTPEMVQSRRRFLEQGYYRPFQNELCKLAEEALQDVPPGRAVILDAGCGEGYYTGALHRTFPQAVLCGYDISRAAVKAAAGKYKGISFAVASSFSIPVPDDFCHLLIDVFSPLAQAEFARVLRPGGIFIYAVPGRWHLMGLKEILYEQPYENQYRETEYSGFTFVSRQEVKREIRIPDAETALDLFAMTPYFWKTGVEGAKRLQKTKGFVTEISFDFLIYRRNAEQTLPDFSGQSRRAAEI